jgi:hypothetical protein
MVEAHICGSSEWNLLAFGTYNFEVAPRFLENLCTVAVYELKATFRNIKKKICKTVHDHNMAVNL